MSNVSKQNPVVQVSEAVQVAPTEQMVNLVAVENNQTVTTSLKVAEVFGKLHKHVLEAIKSLDCSEKFRETNFRPSKFTYSNGNIKKQLPMYHITRDGFMFLVMGFTGKTAAKWKEAFIDAFNEMEAKLRERQTRMAINMAVYNECEKDPEYAEYIEQLKREEREEELYESIAEEMEQERQRAAEAEKAKEAEAEKAKEAEKGKEAEAEKAKEAEAEKAKEAEAEKAEAGAGVMASVAVDEPLRIDTTRCGWHVISSKEIARLTGRPHSDVVKSMLNCAKYCKRSGRVFIKAESWEAYKYGCRSMMWSTYNGVKLMHQRGRAAISDRDMAAISCAFRGCARHLPPSLPLPVKTDATPTKQHKPKTPPTPTAKPKPQVPHPTPVATMPQTPADLMQRFVKAMGVMMGMDANDMFNLMQKGE